MLLASVCFDYCSFYLQFLRHRILFQRKHCLNCSFYLAVIFCSVQLDLEVAVAKRVFEAVPLFDSRSVPDVAAMTQSAKNDFVIAAVVAFVDSSYCLQMPLDRRRQEGSS